MQNFFDVFSQISGPQFLFYYCVFISVLLLLTYRLKGMFLSCHTANIQATSLSIADPVKIAYLADGARRVFILLLTDAFVTRRLCEQNENRAFVDQNKPDNVRSEIPPDYDQMYQRLIKCCSERGFSSVYNIALIQYLQRQCRQMFGRGLEKSGLLPKLSEKLCYQGFSVLCSFAILGVLILRLYTASLEHHNNIIFMVLLASIGIGCEFSLTFRRALTTSGEQALERVRKSLEDRGSPIPIQLLVATMGPTVLLNTQYAFLYRSVASGSAVWGCGLVGWGDGGGDSSVSGCGG